MHTARSLLALMPRLTFGEAAWSVARDSARSGRPRWQFFELRALLVATVLAAASTTAAGQTWTPPDTFTATTAEMKPAGVKLKIDVKEWSTDDARAAVVDAIGNGDADALAELPTIGYVWPSGSGVGYSLKYAFRTTTPEGERLIFVTDRAVGSYDFQPWAVSEGAAGSELGYSVIELDLDASGNGDGTLSLGAEVSLDTDAHTVSLSRAGPRLLTSARAEPKPYWATGD